MAGCMISPLAFTMAMEVVIRASKWVVGRERRQDGMHFSPIGLPIGDYNSAMYEEIT